MLAFIRYTAGLGNTAIYARLRNATGQFWDFVGLTWVGTETADCKVNMTERDDSDTVDSLYAINLTMPSGGPWIQEAVLASSGGVLGVDTTALDAKASDILTESQSHPTLAEIEATTVLAKLDTLPIQVMSATKGAIQVSYAKTGGTVEVVKGDTISIPYGPLGKDITGRKVYFAAKQLLDDSTYKIAVNEITAQITDAATFTGTIPLTSAELNLAAGNYYAEIESRASDGTSTPATELKFILRVVDQVIE